MTVQGRIKRYLGRWPGRTATQVARAIKVHPATVSSILYRDHRRGLVNRSYNGGPRNGKMYYAYNKMVNGE